MENQTAVEQFLKGTADENKVFSEVAENLFDQPTEQKEEVIEEKPLPFHKDPKLQKYIEKEISKGLEKQTTREVTRETPKEDEFKEFTDSFTLAIGNDTPEKVAAINAYKNSLIKLDQRAIEKATQAFREEKEREMKADREAEEEIDNAFEQIEQNYSVDLSKRPQLRSEFITFVEKIAPKDQYGEITGYPDMNSAWETFSEIKKSNTPLSRSKALASRGLDRSTEATTGIQPKRMNWRAVDEFLDTQ